MSKSKVIFGLLCIYIYKLQSFFFFKIQGYATFLTRPDNDNKSILVFLLFTRLSSRQFWPTRYKAYK